MRLDLFLKASRLVLRRSVAKQLCDAGAVKVNGVSARASRELSIGDEISIKRGLRTTVARIVAIPTNKQVSRGDASALVDVISDVKEQDPLLP
jgi:ribosomal 50S subunit-recycling heat shock protein